MVRPFEGDRHISTYIAFQKWKIYTVKITIIHFVVDFRRNGTIKNIWSNCKSRKGVSDRFEKSWRYLIEFSAINLVNNSIINTE